MRIEEVYLNNILAEITRAKEQGRNGIYRINDKIDDASVEYVKNYFAGKAEYDTNFKKCATCLGTWDVLIKFKGI